MVIKNEKNKIKRVSNIRKNETKSRKSINIKGNKHRKKKII
jgi:hypothetical protein